MTLSRRRFLGILAFSALSALAGCAGKTLPSPSTIKEEELPPDGQKKDTPPAPETGPEQKETKNYCADHYCAKLRLAKDADGKELRDAGGDALIEGLYFPPMKGRNGAAIERYTIFKEDVTVRNLVNAETIAVTKTEEDARKIVESRRTTVVVIAPAKPAVVMDEKTKEGFGGEEKIIQSTEVDLRALQQELLKEVESISGFTKPLRLPKLPQTANTSQPKP